MGTSKPNQKNIVINVYEEVTNRIIAQLEKGVCPWKSPYFSSVGFPTNFATKKHYRGINVFLLGMLGYTSPYFLTFVQAKELGGYVKKGEKGHLVIKYGTFEKELEEPAEDGKTEQKRGYLKSYVVFNASQIEGIEFPTVALPIVPETDACDEAKRIVAGMPDAPEIKTGSSIPFYQPSEDFVSMPERAYFVSEEAFFNTLFHELTHSTGHQKRLGRKSLLENKGLHASRKVYAEEELVAEMGASFLGAHAGIFEAEIENSAAYLKGWIDALKTKDAKSWIIRAASQAQRAADFILGL